MSKKKNQIKEVEPISTSLVQLMEDGFARYSKLVIQSRALPDVRDGLKPVQRRILYAMYKDGNTFNKAYRKSAKTVGNVIGNYHPHGDGSVYEAMVNMSQDWKMGAPLIDMQGNNGSIDGDSAAAMRYTESRLSSIAEYLLNDIDQETVDFTLNYSDTEYEPIVLPASFCNLLVNGSTGIASGYATEIPSFNFNEILKACIYRLNNPQCSFEDIVEIVPGPDFATGGIIEGKKDIQEFLKTGKGRFTMRCVVNIHETKRLTQLVVTEISYGIKKSDLVKRINDVRINQNIDDILEVRDESDRTGLRIVIDVKKEADAQNILNILYKETELQSNYNGNMYAVVNNRPALLSLLDIIDAYLAFRVEVFRKKTQYQLDKKQKRISILEALIKAVSHLDEVIKIIRGSQNKSDSKKNLIERFGFTDEQAEAIVTLQLYRLSNTDIVSLKEEFALLLNEIDFLTLILDNDRLLINEVNNEFKELNEKYQLPRKTKVNESVAEITVDREALIAPEEFMVSVSSDGYIKRTSLRSYNASDQYYSTLKQGDRLIGQSLALNLSNLLVFTESGQYFSILINDIDDVRWKEIGNHYSSMISGANSDRIVAAMIVPEFESDYMVTIVTANGQIKKTQIREFENVRTNRLYRAINLRKKDRVVAVLPTSIFDSQVLLITRNGYMARYDLEQVSLYGLNAGGVKAMNLSDDEIVDGFIFKDQSDIVVLTDTGLVKRFKESEVETTGRPVKGNLIAKRVKSNPNHMKQMIAGNINDVFPRFTLEKEVIAFKDVTLMNLNQTFSSMFSGEDFVVKEMKTIPIEKEEIKKDNPSTKVEQVVFDLD